jgi:hypothetical protein
VIREAELERPSRVACSDLLDHGVFMYLDIQTDFLGILLDATRPTSWINPKSPALDIAHQIPQLLQWSVSEFRQEMVHRQNLLFGSSVASPMNDCSNQHQIG